MRVLGDVTEGDALDVLRDVDEVFIETIREWGLYDRIWQAFAVFLPVRCAQRSTQPHIEAAMLVERACSYMSSSQQEHAGSAGAGAV